MKKQLFLQILCIGYVAFSSCSKTYEVPDLRATTVERSVENQKTGLFYYSGQEKIYLKEDTTIITIKTADSEAETVLNELQSSLKSSAFIEYVSKLENGAIELKVGSNAKAMLKSLRTNPKIVYSWHSLKLSTPEFQSESTFIPTGELLLKPKKGTTLNDVVKKFDLAPKRIVRTKDQFGFDQILIESDDVFNIANRIHESGLVEWCHPNFWVPQTAFHHPSDWYYADQFYFKNWGQYGGVVGMDMNIEPAWDITKVDPSITIAVVDDGVEPHEDLPSSRISSGHTPRSPSTGNGNPTSAGKHGEAVAGIIAATQDNDNPAASVYTISGAAPHCKVLSINIFYDGLETPADNASGIAWAWQTGGADVINNSWGYNPGVSFTVIQNAITDAISYGRSGKGCIVTGASGNITTSTKPVLFPANATGVITVGAIDRRGLLSTYSCYGPSMDLVAYSSYQLAPLGDVETIDRMGNPGYLPAMSGGSPIRQYYAGFSGTSAACPQVSGVAALMLSINPGLTEVQVKAILQTTAIDMGASGFDETYGYGRLNAYGAVYQASITPVGW